MEDRVNNVPEADLAAQMPKKVRIDLPVIALALDFAPVLFVLLASLHEMFLLLLLYGIFCPIAGMIAGVIALCQGKKRIGTVGVILSAIAVALPIIFVIAVILSLQTGALALGM